MTPILLPDELADRLQHIAENEHTTVVELLEQYVADKEPQHGTDLDALRQMRGMIKVDIPDASENINEVIREYLLKREHERIGTD